jgi:lantibiotic biosynthesis protein
MNPGDAALTVAERLLDPNSVLTAAPANTAATLADGLAGTALLHARLARVDTIFEKAARAHWDAAAAHAARDTWPGCGTYGVLGGLATSLILGSPYLSDLGTTARATSRSVRWLSASAVHLAESYTERVRSGTPGTQRHVYDTVSGLAGIGRVLLAAILNTETEAESGLHAALAAMTHMLTDRGQVRPGWWVASEPRSGTDASGRADTGLAHGVAGPLAFLAAAEVAGYHVPGQEAAIRDTVRWLERWRTDHLDWQPYVSGHELDSRRLTPRPGRRSAWCYGTPGIARALLASGRALHDAALIAKARADLRRMAAAPADRDVEGPTLCHGYSGIMRCASGLEEAIAAYAGSVVVQHADPSAAFVFPHIEHGRRTDNAGFLTGAAGVALTLAEHAELAAAPVTTPWDALLLVS